MKIKSFITQEFFRNAIVHWVSIASFLINGVCWGALVFFIRPVDFPIILHYNVYFGVDIIGAWWQAYFLPLIALAVMAVNMVLAYYFYKHGERMISYILLLAAFLVQISGAIAIGGIIRINY
ncbi:MAG TPA: hypothetical protein DCX32_01985 [Candidatus Moranbacteria bacterium]|nr:hypothetical protein [Candidatus Moranbacteria bacterium]